MKLHGCDAHLARRAIKSYHITRAQFRDRYRDIYGKPIRDATAALLLVGEAVRDNVMHGKGATDDEKRNAIAHVLCCAQELNDLTVQLGRPKLFGDLRGFKGAAQSLDKSTSRWILKGMSCPV